MATHPPSMSTPAHSEHVHPATAQMSIGPERHQSPVHQRDAQNSSAEPVNLRIAQFKVTHVIHSPAWLTSFPAAKIPKDAAGRPPGSEPHAERQEGLTRWLGKLIPFGEREDAAETLAKRKPTGSIRECLGETP